MPPTWCWRRSTSWSTRWSRPPGRTGPRDGLDRWARHPGGGGRRLPARSPPAKTDVERTAEAKEKTGVFIGAYATNPVNGAQIPIFIADYVLAGYGTGAIMAVPGQDERDWEFAEVFELPIVRTVQPTEGFDGKAFTGRRAGDQLGTADGFSLDGLGIAEAKATIIEWLEEHGYGQGAVTYRLRDWLFSRQRYWGEPFPIVYDETGLPIALPESMLPVELPEIDDFSPKTFDPDDADSTPETPLSRAADWVEVELDLGDGPQAATPARRTRCRSGPARAGTSCATWTRPTTSPLWTRRTSATGWARSAAGDSGGVDLYVGGVEHAVLHLLYARFWHKVLYDLGHVSSFEPFRRLFNQGYIQAYAYTDARGALRAGRGGRRARRRRTSTATQPVSREYGKMGKSLKNVVTPDEMCAAYGADTFRVYEMSMGPLDVSRPVGDPGGRRLVPLPAAGLAAGRRRADRRGPGDRRDAGSATRPRLLHRTIDGVRADMDGAAVQHRDRQADRADQPRSPRSPAGGTPRAVAEPLVLMMAPFAPHLAEELWQRLGHAESLAYADFPVADPALLVAESVTYPVQVNGKVRGRVEVAAGRRRGRRSARPRWPRSAAALDGREPRKVIVVPGRMVSVVVERITVG